MATSHIRAGASAGLGTCMSTAGNADMSAFAHSLTHIGRAIAFAGLSSILMGAAVTLGANTAWAGEASPQSLASKEVEKTPVLASKEAKKPQAPDAKKEVAPRASETKETAGKSAPELKKEVAQPAPELKKTKTESALEANQDPKQGKDVNQMVQRAAMDVRAAKPAPQQPPQVQKTELKVSLCWETMNKDNKNAFVKGDSDFGQLNFGQWDFGSTLDSSRKDVKEAFGKIQFQIKDTTTNTTVKTAGTYDSNTATSATKSLGSYDSTHTYKVSVVNSTIPSPYYVTYNNVDANEGPEFTSGATSFTWTPSNGSNKTYQNKSFRLNVLEIVYAKDKSVADKCFSYEQPKNADGSYRSDGNWNFSYNKENIFARLRVKDNKIQFPEANPVKSGYKFAGWQFYVARRNDTKLPYTSYDRMGDDDQTIIKNTTVAYVPFNEQTTTYPYLFAVLRDSKGVNTFGSKLGTQYCSTNHTFVVFPKWEASGYTVTFMNDDKQLAEVKVQENKSIDGDEWTSESMPAAPTQANKDFAGWNTEKNGTGDPFTKDSIVKSDMTVYAQFKDKTKPKPKPKPEPMPTPTPGPYYPLPEPTPAPDVSAPAPTPAPEHKVPAIEAPTPAVPATPATPATAPKHACTLPQTSDPTLLSSLAALPVALGACLGAGAALLTGARGRTRRRHSARR